MTSEEELKRMIKSFRLAELQLLLSFAGRSKIGRKQELMERALELCKLKSQPLHFKVQFLYNSMQRWSSRKKRNANATESQPVDLAANGGDQDIVDESWERDDCISILEESDYQNKISQANKPEGSAQAGYKENSQGVTDTSVQLAINPLYFPVHPDVKFKKLPFYKVLYELLRPSSLVPQAYQLQQKSSFMFYVTPQQAAAISVSKDSRPGVQQPEHTVQGQLRFCLLETTSKQDDCFPAGLIVRVNNKFCSLKETIPRKKKEFYIKDTAPPVNITALMKLNPAEANTVEVQWNTEYGLAYVMGIFLVQKKTSEDLLNRLKAKGIRGADYTRGMIKDKLNEDADSEIVTTSLRVSLVCPLGKMRLKTPCRATTCEHLQCFDASLYIQMNERKPLWVCPVCDESAEYDKLVIDGYFQEILSSDKLPPEINEIELHSDGSWSPLIVKPDPVPNSDPYFFVKLEAEMKVRREAENRRKEEEKRKKEEEEKAEKEITIEKTVCPPPLTVRLPVVALPSTDKPTTVTTVEESSQSKEPGSGSSDKKVVEIDLTVSDSDDEPLIWFKRRESSKNKRNGVSDPSSSRTSPAVINLDSDSSDSLQVMPPHSIRSSLPPSLGEQLNSDEELQDSAPAPKDSNDSSILPWFQESAVLF